MFLLMSTDTTALQSKRKLIKGNNYLDGGGEGGGHLSETFATKSLYLEEGFVDGPKSRLLVIVENSPVPVENEDAVVLCFPAVAAVDAVVRTVVPLAREHMEALWDTQERRDRDRTAGGFLSNLNAR